MVWLEIETKVKIPNSDVKNLRKKIKKISKFEKKGKKVDDYFAIKRKGYPKKAFRIRAMKGKYEINFKKWLKRYWTKSIVVKEEHEFELKNREQMDEMLALFRDLGFEEWVRKVKWNETYKYKKNKRVSIELNKLKNLGYFMEIEFLGKKKELKKARKIIGEILEKLEIDSWQIDNTGYTKMLWYKGTKGKKKFIE